MERSSYANENYLHRLSVLRGLFAETTNAAKTSSPIKTDIQLLGLLRKRAAASKAAAEEFASANRDDLRQKELSQAAIMDEYASSVETTHESEIIEAIQEVLGKLRTDGISANTGRVLKELLRPGGLLAEKPVEKAEVAKLVKGLV